MKKKIIVILAAILALSVCLLSGCAETIGTGPADGENAQTEKKGYTVSVSVDAGELGGYFGGGIYTYEQQPTAYDALVSTGLEVEGSGYYVSGVNGLKELQHGPMSGWIYHVNGESPSKNPGDYYLEDGDIVTWTYQIEE